MGRAVGHSPSTIHRIWQAFGLQPHRSESFKLSSDPFFVEKVRDIVGLYMAPPERALVLCVDDKSQIQALDRSQPLLAMRPGRPSGARMMTSVTARSRSSPRSIVPAAKSSGDASSATGQRSSRAFSTPSRTTCRRISTSTSSWTTSPRTRRPPSRLGSPGGPGGASTSRRPAHRGSIRSSASSPS